MVTITVVCCSPEKIRDKLCCKGGKTIKSILIVEPKLKLQPPPSPTPPPSSSRPPSPSPSPSPQHLPPSPSPQPPPLSLPPPKLVPICLPVYPIGVCCESCYEGRAGGPCYHGYRRPMPCYDGCCGYGGNEVPHKPEKPKAKPPPLPPLVPASPQPTHPPPESICICPQPSHPPPESICICPQPYPIEASMPMGVCCGSCYEGRAGGPCYHGYGGDRVCYVTRCDDYFSEENATSCTIM